MSKFDEFPKGEVKRNHNFYGWAFVAAMLVFMGIMAVIDQEFQYRSGTPPKKGGLAVSIGIIFISPAF